MDLDPMEQAEQIEQAGHHHPAHHAARPTPLSSIVAVTIALLATFMGICKVKTDNFALEMQRALTKENDAWSYYQARHIREDVAHSTADQLRLTATTVASGEAFLKTAAAYEQTAKKQAKEKDQLQEEAKKQEERYQGLLERKDQFDLCEAALTVAIAMLAVTTLTQAVWLYGLALLPALFGIVMGLAGLLGWGVRPEVLIKFLGA